MNCPLPRHAPPPPRSWSVHPLPYWLQKHLCVYPALLTKSLREKGKDWQSHAVLETHPGKFQPAQSHKLVSVRSDTDSWPHIWHCFQALLLSKEGVLSVNLRLGTTNLYEVSHREGGSPSKFQTELGIMQTPICKDPDPS